MEGIERCPQLLDELEGDLHAINGILQRIAAVIPRPNSGARTERIGTGSAERMPINHAEAKMLLHGLPFDHFVWVVPAKCQRITRLGAFVFNLANIGERAHDFFQKGC